MHTEYLNAWQDVFSACYVPAKRDEYLSDHSELIVGSKMILVCSSFLYLVYVKHKIKLFVDTYIIKKNYITLLDSPSWHCERWRSQEAIHHSA